MGSREPSICDELCDKSKAKFVLVVCKFFNRKYEKNSGHPL